MKSKLKLKGTNNMKLILKLTQRLLLFCFLPLASLGADLYINIIQSTNTYTLGDSIPTMFEIRNEGRMPQFFNQDNLTIQVQRKTDDKPLDRTGFMGPGAPLFISSNHVVHLEWDINKLFSIKQSGKYAMDAIHTEYLPDISRPAGVETGDGTRLVVETRSDKVFFTVLPLDQQMIDNIERLLHSKKEEEQLEGIALLSNAGNGMYREVLPTLWSIVKKRQSPVSDKAFILVLNRIDIAVEIVPITELFSELADATTNPDVSLRIAVAESIFPLRTLQYGRDENFRIDLLKISQWFDRETSPACRATLVSRLPLGTNCERIITIAQEDPSPQVRLAAIQYLATRPNVFLKSADTFTNLVEQVTVDGEEISLEEFVEQEKERLGKRYGK